MGRIADKIEVEADILKEPIEQIHIAPITFRDAKAFVEEHHRHLKNIGGCKFCIGIKRGEELLGCAICGRPVSRRYDDGYTLEINRVCTDGTRNACSMLYGACCRTAKAMGYKRVVTYTLQSETGASLRASNFACEGEAGGTHWTGERNRGQDIPNEKKVRWAKYF